jgi:hypothetical protein
MILPYNDLFLIKKFRRTNFLLQVIQYAAVSDVTSNRQKNIISTKIRFSCNKFEMTFGALAIVV